jgi:hypothetical protein
LPECSQRGLRPYCSWCHGPFNFESDYAVDVQAVNTKGRDKSELHGLLNEIKELLIYRSDLKVNKVKKELIRVTHEVALYATINVLVSS